MGRFLSESGRRCDDACFICWVELCIADEPLEGYERVYVNDPFGNRIELMETK